MSIFNRHIGRLLPATLLVVSGILALPACGATFVTVNEPRSRVEFTSKATLETVTGKAKTVTAQFEVDPADITKAKGKITVDLKSLDTGMDLRNKHMRENHLETGKYPDATFVLDSVTTQGGDSLSGGQTKDVIVHGSMSLHGVTRPLSPTGKVTWHASDSALGKKAGGNVLQLQTSFPIKLADYAIPRPEFLFLKLSEDVTVTVELFVSDRR